MSTSFLARRLPAAMLVALPLALAACASGPERAVYVPVVSSESSDVMTLTRDVSGKLSDGQPFLVTGSSRWRRVGALVQGDVYRPLGAALAIGKNTRADAYLVASSGRLIGFYLPAGSLFLPLDASQVLPFSQRQ